MKIGTCGKKPDVAARSEPATSIPNGEINAAPKSGTSGEGSLEAAPAKRESKTAKKRRTLYGRRVSVSPAAREEAEKSQ